MRQQYAVTESKSIFGKIIHRIWDRHNSQYVKFASGSWWNGTKRQAEALCIALNENPLRNGELRKIKPMTHRAATAGAVAQ